ncbi:MAG: hypothetical protein WA630_01030 [Mycobacterium sp.]
MSDDHSPEKQITEATLSEGLHALALRLLSLDPAGVMERLRR